jgi:hypothetical protein
MIWKPVKRNEKLRDVWTGKALEDLKLLVCVREVGSTLYRNDFPPLAKKEANSELKREKKEVDAKGGFF